MKNWRRRKPAPHVRYKKVKEAAEARKRRDQSGSGRRDVWQSAAAAAAHAAEGGAAAPACASSMPTAAMSWPTPGEANPRKS